MNALSAGLRRRRLNYFAGLTVLVGLLGTGGMLVFEPASEVQGGFAGYAEALWWTAMLLTSMGSQFWPLKAEGRILCFLLALRQEIAALRAYLREVPSLRHAGIGAGFGLIAGVVVLGAIDTRTSADDLTTPALACMAAGTANELRHRIPIGSTVARLGGTSSRGPTVRLST